MILDHIGFGVGDYDKAKAFYTAGAFVPDPDGHNIEAVCHKSE